MQAETGGKTWKEATGGNIYVVYMDESSPEGKNSSGLITWNSYNRRKSLWSYHQKMT